MFTGSSAKSRAVCENPIQSLKRGFKIVAQDTGLQEFSEHLVQFLLGQLGRGVAGESRHHVLRHIRLVAYLSYNLIHQHSHRKDRRLPRPFVQLLNFAEQGEEIGECLVLLLGGSSRSGDSLEARLPVR